MKYSDLLRALERNKVYSPALIANLAAETGYLDEKDPLKCRSIKQRIRVSLSRFSNNHFFPDEGDNMVEMKGQAPTPGWFGWRWQEALLLDDN